jgi:hypothetical protein
MGIAHLYAVATLSPFSGTLICPYRTAFLSIELRIESWSENSPFVIEYSISSAIGDSNRGSARADNSARCNPQPQRNGNQAMERRSSSHSSAEPTKEPLSRLLVETTILVADARSNGANVLRDAANLYKVDTDAIGQKVKQKFAAKANKEAKTLPKAKRAA